MRLPFETFVESNLPEIDPIICFEETDYGWRGLTSHGEVLEVRGANGHKASVPVDHVIVSHQGRPIGKRLITNEMSINIDEYLLHFNRVIDLYHANKIDEALASADRVTSTLRGKFNRAMVLLAAGRWSEGFAEYWECERYKPFMRPQVERAIALGLRPWMGENLAGKRLLLLHAHGFGDTIMMLRYVERIKDAVMVMPPELQVLASEKGRVANDLVDADYFCPILHLLHHLRISPRYVKGDRYLTVLPSYEEKWRRWIGHGDKRRIGVVWSIGKPSIGDYPREIDLGLITDRFDDKVELYSLQVQGSERADACGVISVELENFMDCAALMIQMDEIITVDTAALHLAGAIGHKKVSALLSYWASWRWLAPWYQNVRLLRQAAPEDWASALDQL